MLADIQKHLSQYLSVPAQDKSRAANLPLSVFKGDSENEIDARLSVYQNNFFYSLIEILQEAFPTINKLTGEEFFKALAKTYIQKSPPANPLLFEYGDQFSNFVRQSPQLAAYPYMADVAQLDWLRHCAYYAPEPKPLTANDFSNIDINLLVDAKLKFHPTVGIVMSDYAIFSIWESNQSEEPQQVNANIAENALILRTAAGIQTYKVVYSLALFLNELYQARNIAEALQIAMESDKLFNASHAIDFLIRNELCAEIIHEHTPGTPI